MIDTHVHIWDPSRATYAWLDGEGPLLNRLYFIEEWISATAGTPVTGGILVQAANNAEDTQLMLEVAENCDTILGVVGWLPLQDPEEVAKYLENDWVPGHYLKGVRHLIHNEPDPRWLMQPEVLESLHLLAKFGLSYDLVGIVPEHIRTALDVAGKVPGLRMVFDHLNQPPIAKGERFGVWGEWMKAAAAQSNFYCKISGLGIPAGKPYAWSGADVEPYIDFVLQQFGSHRCFCGGDWPVSLLAGDYGSTVGAYQSVLEKLLDAEALERVLVKNAGIFYKL